MPNWGDVQQALATAPGVKDAGALVRLMQKKGYEPRDPISLYRRLLWELGNEIRAKGDEIEDEELSVEESNSAAALGALMRKGTQGTEEANPYHGQGGRFASKDDAVQPGQLTKGLSTGQKVLQLAKAGGKIAATTAAATMAARKMGRLGGLVFGAGAHPTRSIASNMGGNIGKMLAQEFGLDAKAAGEVGRLAADAIAKGIASIAKRKLTGKESDVDWTMRFQESLIREVLPFEIVVPLREAEGPTTTANPDGSVDVVLISEGFGNRKDKNVYPAKMLEASYRVFEGVKCFLNHPTKSEERDRPERDVLDVCGWFSNCRLAKQGDKTAVVGRLNFLGTTGGREARELIESDLRYQRENPGSVLVGFSLSADGDAHDEVINGEVWNVVDSLDYCMSTDLVTFPARGGRALGNLRLGENDSAKASDWNQDFPRQMEQAA